MKQVTQYIRTEIETKRLREKELEMYLQREISKGSQKVRNTKDYMTHQREE